ncbi:alkaline phosphatase-like protein [Periconia macrospinosa]|uniref:Alkaline phosphatase-like protein n=1 Tax=Periconia macrospinosa TaxID=97972 RepID=A0A2V1CYR3_9PLEO|nr:alkaline phosphatase-like protein [Periconia macrospinosa]
MLVAEVWLKRLLVFGSSTLVTNPSIQAVFSSKTLHISQHFSSLKLLHLIIYLPTLFAQDVSNYIPPSNSAFIALVFVATAVQFGFYMETGLEVDWLTGISFMRNPSGLKVLMSGSASVYRASGAMVSAALACLTIHYFAQNGGYHLPQRTLNIPPPVNATQGIQRRHTSILLLIIGLSSIILLQWNRPSIPYDHLSDSIPFAVLKAWHQVQTTNRPVRQKYETSAMGNLNGLTWSDDQPLQGFDCWLENKGKPGAYPGLCDTHQHRYKAMDDPLKISNLDLDLLLPLQQTFQKSAANITHIILLTLESTRDDVFPIRPGSPMHERILRSQGENQRVMVDRMLARLTPVAHKVAGDPFTQQGNMGGISVDGAVTGSTYTVKSLLGSHCGVYPMPFDFLREVEYDIYQPCIPHILNLFNHVKDNESDLNLGPTDVHSRPWTSAFLQSVETYDWNQDLEIKQMGFDILIDADTLRNETAKHYPPKSPVLNYFGYAEPELKPYLKDIINDAVQSQKRLFLSHLTSTTHHPWDVPSSFIKKEYMGSHDGIDHTDFNKYLNALSYADQWLGDVLDSLDEAGITNETLVVIVGDHGFPFPEDSKSWGVTGNPHNSAFRIPLIFRHPNLPRIQVTANASSMSILPTILDLLIQSNSLDKDDTSIASALIKQYQGQSLLRPFRNIHNGLQCWNFAIIAPGGSLLAISSAAVPYRLIMPLTKNYEYRFTNLDIDPAEVQPLVAWSLGDLRTAVHNKYDPEASSWVGKAAEVGNWWLQEQDRLWNNHDE